MKLTKVKKPSDFYLRTKKDGKQIEKSTHTASLPKAKERARK